MYFEYIHSEIIDDRIDAQFFTPEYIKSLKKINQFRIETLGNISRRIFDPPHTAPEFVDKSDFEMIMIENITLNGIEGNFRAISETCHKDIFKNSHLEGNELLVSRVGNSSGTFASVFPCYKGKNVSGNISIIKLKDEIIDKEYAFAYFNSNIGQNSIKRNIANTARKFLTISKIREFQVPIPSPEIQKYIGDKVRKAEELREEAKKLKKEAEEIIYKKLGNIVLEDEKNYTANYIREEDIFERIDSEYYKEKYFRLQKQLKSKGFSLKTLDELCDSNIFNGRTYKTTNKKRKYMNIGVGELGDWFILANGDKYIDENINTNYLLDRYSIIWGNSAHLAKYIGEKVNINLETNSYVPTTEITCIKPNLDKINPYYLFLYMKSNWGYYQVQRTVKGMTAHSYPEDVSKIIVPILDFSFEELNVMKSAVELGYRYTKESKQLVQEAKQDVEDLIEGNFDMSKVRANS